MKLDLTTERDVEGEVGYGRSSNVRLVFAFTEEIGGVSDFVTDTSITTSCEVLLSVTSISGVIDLPIGQAYSAARTR